MGATLSTDRRLLLLSVPVAVATGVVAFWWMRKQRARTYLQVGFVSALNVYPVKSCRAISLEHAECLVTGIKYDRYSIVYTLKSQPRVVLCFVYSATAYRQRQRGSYRGRNQMAISTLKGVHSHAMRWLQRLNRERVRVPYSIYLMNLICSKQCLSSETQQTKIEDKHVYGNLHQLTKNLQ